MWKRSHGRATKAPPNERGGNSYVQPTATAPHLDSTLGHERGPALREAKFVGEEDPHMGGVRAPVNGSYTKV
jgi:hypothetical protein